ncbi:V-type proton ATPase subunit S1-like [Clytia hemisphaerica]|uniref:V-type proton ATPase subunit S1/VOA1 transmembrane domain-containing protein n=1 Tax=Clytia hemisphaerica TaxID=252671 RepID=A0A7M5X1F4_9CNID
MAAASWASLVTLLTLSISFSCSSFVPVISWWDNNGIKAPSVYAGHSIYKKEFQSLIQPILSKTNVLVLFLQDELSIDDFTRHSQSFVFVKRSLANSNHVTLPSVNIEDESVLDYIKTLRDVNIIDIPLGSDNDFEVLKKQFKDNTLNIVVVKLEPLRDGNMESKDVILKRNDATMDSMTQAFSKLSKKITYLYTSEDLSMDIQNILVNEELDNSHNIKSRHILEDDKSKVDNSSKFIQSNCVMMNLYGLSARNADGKNFTNLLDAFPTNASGKCQNGSSEIVMKFTRKAVNVTGIDLIVTVTLVTINGTGEWACDSIKANGSIGKSSINSSFTCGNHKVPWIGTTQNTIMAPHQFSFACNDMVFTDGNFTVMFQGLQLQIRPFNSSSARFLDAYHCEGFFTLEILTGLLVGALLIASLYLGTMMMMNIQTQDRFDDPKGKTIQVAVQE